MTEYSPVKKLGILKILKEFHDLPRPAQESLLKDLYKYSEEVRLVIENRVIGAADFSDLVGKMERETVGKVRRRRIPNGRTVNAIVSSAKKSRAPYDVMMQLEQLAYQGFIEFLNTYGGGPDSFLDHGPRHLSAYLKLVKRFVPKEQQEDVILEVKQYLLDSNNMLTDYVDDVFTEETGMMINRL